MLKRFLVVIGLLFSMATLTFAGTTGKIAGRVTDKKTGEPLPGANVYLEGTVFGSTTDLNGNYVILNVPPGKYTLIVQYVGYREIRMKDVRVAIDLTTRLDFQMQESTLESTEEIVVESKRKLIQKDITASQASVSADEIKVLPVTEMSDILQLQAGVTRDASGGFHIRGGRSNEIAYWVNGVSVTDAFDNSMGIELDNNSIQELQVISGTFNAEYGNAMSGIINAVTKEGGPNYAGNIKMYMGDNLSNFTEYFYYIDHFNPLSEYNIQSSLSGPVPLTRKKIRFFANARYNKNDGYLYGQKRYNPDGSWASADTLLPVQQETDPKARYVTKDGKLYKVVPPMSGKPVPMNWSRRYNAQAKITFFPLPVLKFNAELLYSKKDFQDYDHSYKWEPDGNVKKFFNSYNTWFSVTHTLNSKTFYTILASFFQNGFKEYLYKNPLDPRYVYSDTLQPIIYAFRTAGTNNHRFSRMTRTYGLKGDFTSQVTDHHLVKFGVDYKTYVLNFDDYWLQAKRDAGGQIISPYQPSVPADTSLRRTKYTRRPEEFSAYIQDKIEFQDMIINVGLRFDYFNSHGKVPKDMMDPNIYFPLRPGLNKIPLDQREKYFYKDATPKMQLSPRLGIAYPISSQGVIHFSYGHFLQIPSFQYLFNGGYYKVGESGQYYGPFGNPDLKAQKTVMYEIGLQQGLFGDFKIDVTGFYRDVRNWISTSPLYITYNRVTYSMYINKDYANVKGITLVLKKRYSQNYSFDISYTFQVAEGSNSSPEDEFNAIRSNLEPTLYLLPLDWDQRHLINGSFYVGAETWGASLIARFGTGLPYTPQITQYTADRGIHWGLQKNSRRKPNQFSMDLRLHKSFKVGGFKFTAFTNIYNLLDNHIPINVFADTGKPDYTTDKTPDDFTKRPNTVAEYRKYPWHYAEPRRVLFGINYNF